MTLTEAIVGRISHDLAGSVGAVASTIELLGIDPSFQSEASPMLKKSTDILMARLRFYRALFGAETKSIDQRLISDFLETLGQKVTFQGEPSSRLDLSLISVGIALLGLGGSIQFKKDELILKGTEILGRPEFKEILNGEKFPVTPENIECHWLLDILKKEKRTLKTEFKANSAKLSIV